MDHTKYYVLKKKAVPEVLLKVVEVKRLLASERNLTIQEAADQIGISRSSFNTKMIFSHFMKMKRDRRSHWPFR